MVAAYSRLINIAGKQWLETRTIVQVKKMKDRVTMSFLNSQKEAARTDSLCIFLHLVFRFTVPVAEITAGPERLLLCLWLRSLNDDLTAIEL